MDKVLTPGPDALVSIAWICVLYPYKVEKSIPILVEIAIELLVLYWLILELILVKYVVT